MPKIDHPRHDDTLGKILSYLVAITTILGIPVALYGYFSSQQASRVDRTFQFYQDFRTAALEDDVNLLVEAWNAKRDEAQKLLDQNDDNGVVKLIESLLKDEKANAALAHVVVFYDGIGSCIDHSLCDANAAMALMKGPADQIVPPYGSYLQAMQSTNPPFAIGIFKVYALRKKWWWSLF